MVDLEKLAIQRDRGYLVRLVLGLIAGLFASAFVFRWLTGADVSGCVAKNVGSETSGDKPAQK
jgi:hypothetical protein